ncbi:DoxX family protein [Nocardia alni]|uniref:DoxX family protein n=1 Tax=Nocardia alni TaxID=2815723 RepID=UPI0020B3012F|nr:DoxX family protein [Nocardia alni]
MPDSTTLTGRAIPMTTATRSTTTTVPGTTISTLGSDIGLLVLRVGFGLLLAVHGTQKLFGWFHGYGLTATGHAFAHMGYTPGPFFAALAGLCEAGGGVLLALGLLTPLAAAIALGTMINAVHQTWPEGFMKGYELPLVYCVAIIALAFAGPGRFSLDHNRPWQRQGAIWGLGAVVLAVVAGLITLAVK